jgi:hypothetical protein
MVEQMKNKAGQENIFPQLLEQSVSILEKDFSEFFFLQSNRFQTIFALDVM